MIAFSHKPVLLEECMQGLLLKAGGVWFDGTVGGGGHSYEILKRTSPSGQLIATDLDDSAIAAASARLGLDDTKVARTLAHTGNISSACIPYTIDTLARNGELKQGELIALVGFGAGLDTGSCLMRWS